MTWYSAETEGAKNLYDAIREGNDRLSPKREIPDGPPRLKNGELVSEAFRRLKEYRSADFPRGINRGDVSNQAKLLFAKKCKFTRSWQETIHEVLEAWNESVYPWGDGRKEAFASKTKPVVPPAPPDAGMQERLRIAERI